MIDPIVLEYRPWSVTKYQVIDKCGKSFFHKHVEHLKEPGNSGTRVGSVVHDIFEKCYLQNMSVNAELIKSALETAQDKLTFEDEQQLNTYLPHIDSMRERLQAFEKKRNVRMKGVELNLAFDHTFKPVDYRDPNVFIKGKIDYAAITDTFVGIIGDHKTGKAKPLEEHYFQLYIYLVLLDVNFPEIKSAQGFIHQVGDSELKWTDPITKEKLLSLRSWIVKTFNSQAPRLQKVKDLQPEPMVSWKCRFCGFAQDCPPGLIEIKKRQKTTTDPNI